MTEKCDERDNPLATPAAPHHTTLLMDEGKLVR
jgi:hypothetical protein